MLHCVMYYYYHFVGHCGAFYNESESGLKHIYAHEHKLYCSSINFGLRDQNVSEHGSGVGKHACIKFY